MRVTKVKLPAGEQGFGLLIRIGAVDERLSKLDFCQGLQPFSSIKKSKDIRQIKLVNESVHPTEVFLQYLLTVLQKFIHLYFIPIVFSPKSYEGLLKENLEVRNAMVNGLLRDANGLFRTDKTLRAIYNEMGNYLKFVDLLINNNCYITCEGGTPEELETGSFSCKPQVTFLVPSPKQRAILNLIIWLEKDPTFFEDAIRSLLQSEPFKDVNFKENWLCLERCVTFSPAQRRVINNVQSWVSYRNSAKRYMPFISTLLNYYNFISIEGLLTYFLRDTRHNPVTIQHVEMYHHVFFNFEMVLYSHKRVLVKNFEAMLGAGYNLLRPDSEDVSLVKLIETLFCPQDYEFFRPFLPELLSLVRDHLGQGSIDATMATTPIYYAHYQHFLRCFIWRIADGQSFGFDTAFSRAVLLSGKGAEALCDIGASPNAIPNPKSGLTLIGQARLYQAIMAYVISNPETTLEDLPSELASLFKKHFSRILALCMTDTLKDQFWKGYTAQMRGGYQPGTEVRISNYISVVQCCINKAAPRQGLGLFAEPARLPAPEAECQVRARCH